MAITSLDEHRRLSADALASLRLLRDHARRAGSVEVEQRAHEIIDRVEQDIFRVAVVGEFKRGKSTLINALLGEELLPADVLPCSATLNRVTYGPVPVARLIYKPDASGRVREEEIPASALVDHVTKLTPDSEARASEIAEAVLYHPVRYCRDKADIIDTPGLNDDASLTGVTLGVLPRVDAALFVILAQSPFSGYEGEFLSRLLSHDLGRVLFVVNRIDEIRRPADRERVIGVVRERIERTLRTRAAELFGEGSPEAAAWLARTGPPRVYGVSGADALDAKRSGDQALLERSGFPAFEAALEAFLAEERGATTLLLMCDAGTAAARKLQQQAQLRRAALAMQAEEFEGAYQSTTSRLAELRGRLAAELARVDQAADALRAALRPRAAALPGLLILEASQEIDAFPLDLEAIGKARAADTLERLGKAVGARLQATARREAERMQLEIEAGVNAEVARLVDLGASLERELASIELRFTAPQATAEQGASLGLGVGAGLGLLSRAFGGPLVGGVLGGAFNGWQIAGGKGAVAGAAAGAVTGFGAAVAGGFLIAALGLPLTWPVVLPILAGTGLASSYGARWFTSNLFAGEQVTRFRERAREAVLAQLQDSAPARVAEVERGADTAITEAFAALRHQVQLELGGLIEGTARTLDELRTRSHRSLATRELDLAEIDRALAELSAAEARLSQIAATVRSAT